MNEKEYKDALIKRVQQEMNSYFDRVKVLPTTDLENELFIIKTYIWQRQAQGEAVMEDVGEV